MFNGRFDDSMAGTLPKIFGDPIRALGGQFIAVSVQHVTQHQRLFAARFDRFLETETRSHPTVFADMPGGWIAGIGWMVEVRDALALSAPHRSRVIHPACGLAKHRRFAAQPFAVGYFASAKMGGNVLGDAHGEEAEIRPPEFQGRCFRTERRLKLEQRFAVIQWFQHRYDFLLQQLLRIMAVVPAQQHRHPRALVSVLINQPVLLPDSRRRVVAPEIDSQHLGMGKPDRAMMIMVGRAGVAHSRQWLSGRPQQWIKEGARVRRTKMPPQPLLASDLEGGLMIGLRHDLATWKLIRHGIDSDAEQNEDGGTATIRTAGLPR
jgi:hypothetical protein